MGNTPLKAYDENAGNSRSKNSPSDASYLHTDVSFTPSDISSVPPEYLVTSPVQFEGPDGVCFDVENVVVDDLELINNFAEFLDRLNIASSQKSNMMALPRERKLALLKMESETKSVDPAKILKCITSVQEADRRKVRKKANESRFLKNLQELEISLRTNNIHWVRNFLDEYRGLEVLIDYLTFRIDFELQMNKSDSKKGTPTLMSSSSIPIKPIREKSSRNFHYVNDLHICMLCLKAILNNTYGLQAVLGHKDCLTQMARVMLVSQLRTSILILDTLSAVCLFNQLNGHRKVMEAVDCFSRSKGEQQRFQTLIYYFFDESSSIDFRVSCLSFVSILCNSAPNLNYRVRLYHEFSELHMDEFLEALEERETHVKLQDLITNYKENNLDIEELLDTSNQVEEYSRDIDELKEKFVEAEEKYTACEFESIKKIANLERESLHLSQQIEQMECALLEKNKNESILSTQLQQQAAGYEEQLKRQSLAMSFNTTILQNPEASREPDLANISIPSPPPPPPWSTQETGPIIPAPPPDMPCVGPQIPDPPPNIGDHRRVSSISKNFQSMDQIRMVPGEKRRIQTNYRLPVLNWCTVTKAQVDGTIFSEIDDENVLKTLDFREFEETFKTKAQPKQEKETKLDTPSTKAAKVLERIGTPKAVQQPVILENNRVRNIGIAMKRIGKDTTEITTAINRMDTKVLNSEFVELLSKLAPTDLEVKTFEKFNKDSKNKKAQLLKEEKFLLELNSIDRLSAKLEVLIFLGSCESELTRLQPQLDCVSAASHAVLSSQSFKKIVEMVLAFGNYMNSSKRGAVYGFKLESLELLSSTWSTDKRQSLMHYLAKTVKQRNPEYASFVTEMRHLQQASQVIMDNLDADIQDLQAQCSKAVKELIYDKENTVLRDFMINYEPKVTKLSEDYKLAKTTYLKCGKYLGENESCVKTNQMFQLLNKFRIHFERVEKENESRKKSQDELTLKRQQQANFKKGEEKVSRDIKHDAAYDGAVDSIISNLKNTPFRPPDNLGRRRDTGGRRRHRQRSQRALTSEHSFTGSEDFLRTESDCSQIFDAATPIHHKFIKTGRQGSVENGEGEFKVMESTPILEEEGDRCGKATGVEGEVRVKREAKKDAMGQPIHDEDSSQDESIGKEIKASTDPKDNLNREVPKSMPISNTNPSFDPGNISPIRSVEHAPKLVAADPPLVNDIAAMFAKPAVQADASSDKKVLSEDPFLKSRPWLH